MPQKQGSCKVLGPATLCNAAVFWSSHKFSPILLFFLESLSQIIEVLMLPTLRSLILEAG